MAETKYYIFFDFEMLCSNRGMKIEDMEAIRLGAVKYNIQTEKVTFFDRYIQPTQNRPLTKFCKELTGITDGDLKEADGFQEVFEEFLSWIGGIKKAHFFSWSKSDLTRLQFDALLHGISTRTIHKIQQRYTDFQAILTKRVTKNNLSVQNALSLYQLDFIGKQHNPMYDAYNTLRIYLSFLENPVKSDLIMVNCFILNEEKVAKNEINYKLQQLIKLDIERLYSQLHDVYKLRHVQKLLKKVKQLVLKYENILINRSGIFTKETIEAVYHIKTFYLDLLHSYQEHFSHSSKVMILDEHMIYPLKQMAV